MLSAEMLNNDCFDDLYHTVAFIRSCMVRQIAPLFGRPRSGFFVCLRLYPIPSMHSGSVSG